MLLIFFFNDTATTEIYTLSLHDALPIYLRDPRPFRPNRLRVHPRTLGGHQRSEEHTSELQSRPHLVCRLLLEKKMVKRDHHGRPHDHVHGPAPRPRIGASRDGSTPSDIA